MITFQSLLKKGVSKLRLWHWKLIPVLPNKMLVSQWRECIAIKRQWEKGTLRHRLVSYVKDYDKSVFKNYVVDVCEEMSKRKIKFQSKYLDEIKQFGNRNLIPLVTFYPEHNDRYLRQCYYNLEEKFDRGIINDEEWYYILSLWEGSE